MNNDTENTAENTPITSAADPAPAEPAGKKKKAGLIVLAAAAAVCIAAVIIIVCAGRGKTVEPSEQIVIETAAPTEEPASAGEEASAEASDEATGEPEETEAEDASETDTAAAANAVIAEQPATDMNAVAAETQAQYLPESTSDSDIGYYDAEPATR